MEENQAKADDHNYIVTEREATLVWIQDSRTIQRSRQVWILSSITEPGGHHHTHELLQHVPRQVH